MFKSNHCVPNRLPPSGIRWAALTAALLSAAAANGFTDPTSLALSRAIGLVAGKQEQLPSQRVDLTERQLASRSMANLSAEWASYFKTMAKTGPPKPMVRSALLFRDPEVEKRQEANLTAPQRQSLARTTTADYVEPEALFSENHVLRMTLEVGYADNTIGKDPVHLRSYNGQLVGPTLHLKRGDTLYMTLSNTLPGERWQPNMMDTLNSFNTTNMHFHGLHVSPNGNSDNVLIQVGPKETQEYEVHIPKDHTPGTYWYHAHRHGSTAGDVASGMSGTLIIEGGLDDIPEIKAAKERVLVLNQIPYIYKNTLPDPNSKKKPPATVTFNLKAGEVEAKYAEYIFGPGNWDQLGRYTTINGVQLPVIRLQPGEVERWRIVDSGQRETVNLRLVPTPQPGGKPRAPIVFREIAEDGLALGKMVDTSVIELWPGYRSDALVKAPSEPGEYLLIDADSPAAESLNGKPESLKYVARVIVEGKAHPMPLPRNAQMAGLRLPSIRDREITGKQEAKYGILLVGGKVVFTIDGKSFDMETARRLRLKDVDEWTLRSINDVGLVTHPFHIHVNPFEVTSIMAPVIGPDGKPVVKKGKPVMKEELTHGRVWRDTVKIPGGGYVKMRTHYTDFIGTFVQHCHILDHEDQGMMELVDIVSRNAPAPKVTSKIPKVNSIAPSFVLTDAASQRQSLLASRGKPVVLFFFKGQGCLHCSQQIAAFKEHYQEFQQRGIQIIGVSSDDSAALKSALASAPCPFPIFADPNGTVFAKYGCVGTGGLQHGTFALNEKRGVVWRTVGASPYLPVTNLLKILKG